MIVLDASAALEWLLQTATGRRVDQHISSLGGTLHAPHLLDIEIVQGLRRSVAMQAISASRSADALQDLMDLRIRRYPHGPFLKRAWALRNNFSAYDAVYVALAEALGAPLITCDSKLRSAPGHHARIEVV